MVSIGIDQSNMSRFEFLIWRTAISRYRLVHMEHAQQGLAIASNCQLLSTQ